MRIRLTEVRKLCGQDETGPSGVCDQSWARINAAISLSPSMVVSFRSVCGRLAAESGLGAVAPPVWTPSELTSELGVTRALIWILGKSCLSRYPG